MSASLSVDKLVHRGDPPARRRSPIRAVTWVYAFPAGLLTSARQPWRVKVSNPSDRGPTTAELKAALDDVQSAWSEVATCLLPECPNPCQRPGQRRGRPRMFCSANCRAKYAYRRGQLDHALDVVEDVADELAERLATAGSPDDELLRRRVIETDQNLRWQLARYSRDRVHRRRKRPGPVEPPPSFARIIHTLHGTTPTDDELQEIAAVDAERRRYDLFWRRATPSERWRKPPSPM